MAVGGQCNCGELVCQGDKKTDRYVSLAEDIETSRRCDGVELSPICAFNNF